MRISRLSYAFLLSFIVCIFLLQWWIETQYPLWTWFFLGSLGFLGCFGFFCPENQQREDCFLLLAAALGAAIALARVSATAHAEASWFEIGWLMTLRDALDARISMLLPEPHASLLRGLLLGANGAMPVDLREAFNTTGLTHIVAISGTNITMLVTVLATLLCWIPLRWRFVPSVLLIILFTLLTGASASAVRAAIMGVLGLLATQLGRISQARLTSLWAAFGMLAWDPSFLWEDGGFQLSFLALIGLLEVSPALAPRLKFLPEVLGIRESLTLTLSTHLTTAPWIAHRFGRLSLIAPLSNLLAPPAVPIATFLGAAALSLSAVANIFGDVAALAAWLPLAWIITVTHILAAIPFASLPVEIGAWTTALCYGALATWIVVTRRSDRSSGA